MPRMTYEGKITFGNIIQITIILIGGLWAYFTVVGTATTNAASISKLDPRVTTLESTGSAFNTRLSVVESRAETSARQQTDIAAKLDRLIDQITTQQLAAADVRKDVGYLRDYVEDQKRQQRNGFSPQ